MKRIFKYTLPTKFGAFAIDMPKGSEIKAVQVQNGIPVMWAFVDSDVAVVERPFVLAATGDPATHIIKTVTGVTVLIGYLGTFQIAGLVYHVFG